MTNLKRLFYFKSAILIFLVIISSCQTKTEIQVPENPSGFEIPQAVTFSMPEGKPFVWKEIPADSVPVGRTMRFDLDRLPSRPFDLQEEVPLKSPLEVTSFDWDQLEEIPFKLDVEIDSLESTLFRLPPPVITPITTPLKLESVNAGILSLSNGQGLPGNTVLAQAIGPDGVHWIGTEKGLVKFTGNEFHLFEIVKSDFTGAVNVLSDLDFTPDGKLVISTFQKGIMVLDFETQIIENFELPYGFSRGNVDPDGNYWGGTVRPEHKFIDFQKRTVSNLDFQATRLNINSSLGSFIDSKNNLWIAFGNGIGIANFERSGIKILDTKFGLKNFNYDFIETSKGEVFISSFNQGLVSVSLEKSTVSILGEDQGFEGAPLDVKIDNQEKIWIGSNQKFTIYDPEKGTLKTIVTNSNITGQGAPAVSIFDSEGMYWSGFWLQGLALYDPSGMDSRHFTVDDGLVSNDTWGIEEDSKSRVWLATYEGLNIYDPKDNSLKLLQIPESMGSNNQRGITEIDDELFFVGSFGGFSLIDLTTNTITTYKGNSETANVFWRAVQREDGTIWMATNNGVVVYDRKQGTMKKVDGFSGLAGNTIWGILEDHLNKIWLVSDSGVNIIDPEKNTVSFLGVLEGLPTVDESVLLRTSEDQMVIGGGKGISIISKDRNLITNVNQIHGLIPDALYDMVESNGRLQLGTENGIVVIDQPEEGDRDQSWKFSNFSRAEGFPFTDYNQSTAKVMSNGKVWWSASPVLSVNLQDPITNSISSSNVEITGVRVMDESPTFFSRYESIGLTEIPDSLGINSTELMDYINKKKIKWDSLDRKTKIPFGLSLPHDQNSITFIYSNPTIKSRDEIEFRYALEGSDQQWSSVTKSSTSKTYFNLLPGDYTFKVITKGFNGVWSDPTSFSFTITPPWWLTWWAFFLYFFALGAMVYSIVQVRSFYLKKENRLLEERVNHRTAQLKQTIDELKSTQSQLIQSEKMASLGELTAGIAHEIQNPLNFVNNFSEVSNELIDEMNEELDKGDIEEVKEIAADIRKNLEKINYHGKRADSIVKGMLQHSRNNSGQKEPTDINAIADEYLRLSYHGLRAKDKSFNADFKLDLDPDLPKLELVPQDIGRVLLNLINNGFYAAIEKKKELDLQGNDETKDFLPTVSVSTKKLDDGIEIRIKDNGNGIPEEIKEKVFQPFFTTKPAGQGTGLGLSMSYEIITKGHQGSLSIDSKEGEYTEFIIILTY